MKKEEYYLGFDIGTNSVGWAVTDADYNVLKFNGKSMWGTRLFNAANTAEERRGFRANRRRMDRKKWRLKLLQEIFAEEICKVDAGFYQRMKDSFFNPEDKQIEQTFSLFNDTNYTDAEYHQEFPTIYHLRKALIQGDKQYDIRLVYLALHHILKHRGHFLFQGVDAQKATSFQIAYEELRNCLSGEFGVELLVDSIEEIENVVKDKKITKRDKNRKLIELLRVDESTDEKEQIIKEVVGLICGSKAKLSKLFSDESLIDAESGKEKGISFTDKAYEELRPELEEKLQERIGVIDAIQGVYSWAILAEILKNGDYKGSAYLSVSKVYVYEKHKKDLQLLKQIVKEYDQIEYRKLFKSDKQKNNYCNYIGSYKKNGKSFSLKRCSKEDFYKGIINLLKDVRKTEENETVLKAIERITEDIEMNEFMPLQVSKDNGLIPYQVHEMELKAILQNVIKTHSFLKLKDERGISNINKIEQLLTFRIPYYVGPLNTSKGDNSWMVRKEEGRILPWNFEAKVDKDASAEKFIRRMTNKCTYLTGEDVLPKNSLLYTEFVLRNELNNVKVKGEKLSVEQKNEFIETKFKKKKKVSIKDLIDILYAEGISVETDDISGVDKSFKSTLTSYLDFRKILGDKIDIYDTTLMLEDLILWCTLYGGDKDILKRTIRSKYKQDILSDEELKKILNIQYTGWGRLSKKLLNGIEGANTKTGEVFTVIGALRQTNDNLMQLLSQEYTFTKEIEALNTSMMRENTSVSYDNLMKEAVLSPSVKRAAWQVVLIAEEVKKIMRAEPKKIFVEMAREHSQDRRQKDSRRQRLIELYKNMANNEGEKWAKELELKEDADLRNIKLYLYCTQMGKCMYTGKTIDLEQLSNKNIYDRDHIYPQSKTKDDSLDNLVLVCRNDNAEKGDRLVSTEIQRKMKPMWAKLLSNGLITKEKYNRLTRTTTLTDEELAGFINRQIVETRQSTKAVASIFQSLYGETEIVYVKAGAVSSFRKTELDYVKTRIVNDYHHAKDAYLNIIVGNVYHTRFTNNPLMWIRKNQGKGYNLARMYEKDIIVGEKTVWKVGKRGTLDKVKAQMNKNNIQYTRYAYCNKHGQNGGLFNQQIVNKNSNASVPIKKGMDVNKYGGYKGITPAYFTLIEYEGKGGKKERRIESVPLYLEKTFSKDSRKLASYYETEKDLKECRILIDKIKLDSLFMFDGFLLHLRGSNEKQLIMQNAVQMCLGKEKEVYIKKIENYLEQRRKKVGKEEHLLREKDGITGKLNEDLYEILLDKHENTIYRKRPAGQIEKIKKGREIFTKLNLEQQVIVIGELLHLFQCTPQLSNLELIGGGKGAGNIQPGKNIMGIKSAMIIYQSVTGLFEQKIDLLTYQP